MQYIKILYFENNLNRSDYPIDFTGLADYRDGQLMFEYMVDDIVTNTIPNYYENRRIYRRADSPYTGTKNDIIETLKNINGN